jgi:CDP-glucose 4,6-dehydratase
LGVIRDLKKPCSVVLITTDKVYENREWVHPYREDDRLGGYDPYSASKACAELVISSYRNSFFNVKDYDNHLKSIAVGRAGNVIGGGDWSQDRLIPDIARAFGNNKKVVIRNPRAVRPWQHVLEPIMGYLLLGEKLHQKPKDQGYAYNFGPHMQDSLPVKDMVDIAIKKWGSGEFEYLDAFGAVHEAGLLKLDISKAVNELTWTPKMTASQAIELTTNWYKAFYTGKNMDSYTLYQINHFLSFMENNN